MDIQTLNDIPSSWKGHEDFAAWLVDYMQPKVTVELGVDYGFSLFTLAKNNPGEVYGIDLFSGDEHSGSKDAEAQYNAVLGFKEKFGATNVTIIRDDFNSVARAWDKQIDILHIDGLHTYEAVKQDFETWCSFMSPTGIILMHDVVAWPGVHKYFSEITLPKVAFEHSAGLGLVSPSTALLYKAHDHFPNII
jgi:predicted O-methyltransferase YrrM